MSILDRSNLGWIGLFFVVLDVAEVTFQTSEIPYSNVPTSASALRSRKMLPSRTANAIRTLGGKDLGWATP